MKPDTEIRILERVINHLILKNPDAKIIDYSNTIKNLQTNGTKPGKKRSRNFDVKV